MLNKDDRKKEWIEKIYQDFPLLKGDLLKAHFIDQMIDLYFVDERKFKQDTYKAEKENAELFKEPPKEIIAIKKIEEVEKQEVTVSFEDNENNENNENNEDNENNENNDNEENKPSNI